MCFGVFAAITLMQAVPTKPLVQATVSTFEDIQIGMRETEVISALRKGGYTVKIPGINEGPGRMVTQGDRLIGAFWVNVEGTVTDADERIYDRQISSKEDGAIELAEALFWVLRDEGDVLDTKKKNQSATQLAAFLSTSDTVPGYPGGSIKSIHISTKSGNHYAVNLNRVGTSSTVTIIKRAPFRKSTVQ